MYIHRSAFFGLSPVFFAILTPLFSALLALRSFVPKIFISPTNGKNTL